MDCAVEQFDERSARLCRVEKALIGQDDAAILDRDSRDAQLVGDRSSGLFLASSELTQAVRDGVRVCASRSIGPQSTIRLFDIRPLLVDLQLFVPAVGCPDQAIAYCCREDVAEQGDERLFDFAYQEVGGERFGDRQQPQLCGLVLLLDPIGVRVRTKSVMMPSWIG